MTTFAPMPVSGYTPQPAHRIQMVNEVKALEEMVLRHLHSLRAADTDGRWLSIGITHIEQAFMAVNRSIFKPKTVTAPPAPAPTETSPSPVAPDVASEDSKE